MLQNIKAMYTNRRNVMFMVLAFVLIMSAMPVAAQTPAPTVSIDIPVSDMITNLNTWIAVFAPILLFVGMIPVALGLLRYIIKLFVGAFGSAK